VVGKFQTELFESLIEFVATGYRLTLVSKPTRRSCCRAGANESIRLTLLQKLFRLRLRCAPVATAAPNKKETCKRVVRQLAALATVVVREENKSAFVETLQQHDPRTRLSAFVCVASVIDVASCSDMPLVLASLNQSSNCRIGFGSTDDLVSSAG
jgi:hypothetical protein